MSKRRTLTLDYWERVTLEQMRDHHRKPYLRERAAGLLKIADGLPAHAVARGGLLKHRKPDSVCGWLKAFERYGLGGLYQKPRRRRTFSPSGASRTV